MKHQSSPQLRGDIYYMDIQKKVLLKGYDMDSWHVYAKLKNIYNKHTNYSQQQ